MGRTWSDGGDRGSDGEDMDLIDVEAQLGASARAGGVPMSSVLHTQGGGSTPYTREQQADDAHTLAGGASAGQVTATRREGGLVALLQEASTVEDADTRTAGTSEGAAPEETVAPDSPAGRTENEKEWQYSAVRLEADLNGICAENMDIPGFVEAVKGVCQGHGVDAVVNGSSREKGGGKRLVSQCLACKHGMKNRQKEYAESASDNYKKARKSSSQRTGCDFKINIRWPLDVSKHPYPRLTTMRLEHLHPVDREADEVVKKLRAPLLSPMKKDAEKHTAFGMKPGQQAVVSEALYPTKVNPRAVPNAAARVSGATNPYDAQELLEKVKSCTEGGGVYKFKLDLKGCISHLFWMTAEQVALATRYGSVLLYDDTAVKNKYRLPLGIGVVIDGEYFSRIVFQSLTVDTRAETFQWILEEFKDARGGAPDVFIQDADVAMTSAVAEVYPGAKKLRCLWHLEQNLIKNLRPLLGKQFNAFLDQFHRARGRLTEEGFEAEYDKLLEAYPASKPYMDKLYRDRERWAVFSRVLTFSVSSFTTKRVAGINSWVRRHCNATTTLSRLFRFLDGAIEKQDGRAILRNAKLRLPSISAPETAQYWFGDKVLNPLKFALGRWPYRFMVDEISMCSVFCSSPDNAVLEGAARATALEKVEYIGPMIVDVETVAMIVENQDGTNMRFEVLGMKDGSHLCSCRTLQVLGLCCRHFWAAMRLSFKYRFHVGILNMHWLAEQGRKPMSEWPEGAKPKWAVAVNHGPVKGDGPVSEDGSVSGEELGVEASPPVLTGGQGGRWQAIEEGVTIESSLVQLKEKGARSEDRRCLYVDCLKDATAAVSIGVETVPPDALRALVAQFVQGVKNAARLGSEGGMSIRNPDVVRLPPTSRGTGKRHRGAHEARPTGAASRGHSQKY